MTAPIRAIGVRFEAQGVPEVQAATRAVQRSATEATERVRTSTRVGIDGASAMGRQYGQAARQIAFAGESIARMGTVSGEAAKQIISQVAMIGMSFGVGGAIVGAIGVASLAVSEYFTGISHKAKQAADDAIKEFNRMAAGSAAAAAAAANALVSGDRMLGVDATPEQRGLRRLTMERRFLLRKVGKPDSPDAYDPNVGPSGGPSGQRRADLARIRELDAAIAALNVTLTERIGLTSELADREARGALATAAFTRAKKAEEQADERRKEAYERSMRDKGYGFSGKVAPRLLTGADKAMFARAEQGGAFAGPKLDLGLPSQAQLDKDMAKTMTDLNNWAVDNVDKIKATVADAVRASYSTLANTIADGLSSAFTAGIIGALSGDMNGAMRQWADQMIGLLARGVADWALKAKLLASAMAKVQAFMTAHPLAAVAAAAALYAIARSMSRGPSFGGGSTGGYGAGSYVSSAAAASSSEQVTRLVWGAESATLAAGMTPRQAINVTIIGPNDPSAGRAIQELLRNANRRGND